MASTCTWNSTMMKKRHIHKELPVFLRSDEIGFLLVACETLTMPKCRRGATARRPLAHTDVTPNNLYDTTLFFHFFSIICVIQIVWRTK